MRDHILSEIKRLAAANGGRALGRQTFQAATGIRAADWLGRYWARWGDAVAEAGFAPNSLQPRLEVDAVLEQLATAARHFGRMPSNAELRLYGRSKPGFPGHDTFRNHFGNTGETTDRLREWVAVRPDYADVAAMLGPAEPRSTAPARKASRPTEGYVYLIRSGDHHKIGRSEELERRVKEIKVALPAAAVLEHAIRTDDPAGIEAYWHRRFADRRANGEWFKLAPADLAAFKRRTFQ